MNVSPNDLQQAAIDMMLDGKQPRTANDWAICANFWAANIHSDVADLAVPVIAALFNCPLSKRELTKIVRFQLANKKDA